MTTDSRIISVQIWLAREGAAYTLPNPGGTVGRESKPGADDPAAWVSIGFISGFDLGEKAFAGLEVSGDKIGTSGTKVAFGVTGRLGAKVTERGKLFVDGGYTTEPCDLCEDSLHAGVGFEQGFGNNLYGKVAYRHYFVDKDISDSDAVTVGLGIKF